MSILPASAITQASSLPTEANRQDACVTRLFGRLEVYRDETPRTAAMNMAIDEALLQSAKVPSLRFYRWNHPALSFGYFGKFADVEAYANERDLVRRWTGGGIVLHGDDLTYSIIIPAGDPAFAHATMSIYEKIHEAIRSALVASGKHAELVSVSVAGVADAGDASAARTVVNDSENSSRAGRGYNPDQCFANPVRADVLVNGEKVAGAAQRKTRGGLLQQGSIQHVDLARDFEVRFAHELSSKATVRQLNPEVFDRAKELAEGKYATVVWLRKC